jgi:hypothetical protein
MQPTPNISKSALVYLEQAMVELIKEQNFQFNDQAELKVWMDENSKAIVERSSDLQMAFFNKVQEHKTEICQVMSAKIWGRIRTAEVERDVQQEITKATR